ncbi:MAG: UMP kinase [Parasporobacterium sp.]|nr:UMP kinase [Parasporobacterium sp.]
MKELKRVLLKLSGEALAKDGSYNEEEIRRIALQVKSLYDQGTQICIVIGGGNIWRGRTGVEIDRPKSDSIGMLATVMNCIYVSEHFRYAGMKTAIMTPFVCSNFTEVFSKDLANEYFEEGKVLFFAGGTGHPYFSTDTLMSLRAIELNVDMILAAKAIDGVYDKDPKTHPDAVRYDRISIDEVVEKKLGVIDLFASCLLMENRIPMRIFSLYEENSIQNSLSDEFNGTEVTID